MTGGSPARTRSPISERTTRRNTPSVIAPVVSTGGPTTPGPSGGAQRLTRCTALWATGNWVRQGDELIHSREYTRRSGPLREIGFDAPSEAHRHDTSARSSPTRRDLAAEPVEQVGECRGVAAHDRARHAERLAGGPQSLQLANTGWVAAAVTLQVTMPGRPAAARRDRSGYNDLYSGTLAQSQSSLRRPRWTTSDQSPRMFVRTQVRNWRSGKRGSFSGKWCSW